MASSRSQLGVKVSLAPLTIFRTCKRSLHQVQGVGPALDELKTFRSGSPAQLALGITHLMTGRDLDGDTVGIAYIGSVCSGPVLREPFGRPAPEYPVGADRRARDRPQLRRSA